MTAMVNTLINGRWTLALPDHRAARPEWQLANGGWERARLDHMHCTTRPGDRVLYVGAEEGEMCALLQSWGADVIMVEPNEAVIPNAKAIWDANGLSTPAGVFVGFCGRSDSADWERGLYLSQWPDCAYGRVIGDHGFKELLDPGGRPIITIDTLLSTWHWVPDAISMDIEGAEWEALQGAEQTLTEHRPRLYLSLHPEFLIDQYGKYSYEVRRWIIDHGYRETLLDYQHEAHFVYEPIGDR
jgi:FkbM family methyltransferase